MIAEIIPEIKTHGSSEFFSYKIPGTMLSTINVGTVVNIPFGKKTIRGVVLSITENKKTNYKLKEIISICNQLMPMDYIEIAKWISNYYLCSFGEAISLFLPPDIKHPRELKERECLPSKQLNDLNSEQRNIYEKISKKTDVGIPALIFGVTGSGKTEIYLHLAKDTVNSGKSVIMLIPEIVLTPQNISRFTEIFGSDVAVMHSGLSKSQRWHYWMQFNSGKKKIIIGPRSALLVPNANLGLIIIDEEQEDSYKQEQNPRYETLKLAEEISKKAHCRLILGSATPRIETYFKAKTGLYDLYKIKSRYNNLMPVAEVVNLKDEIKKNNYSTISERLNELITKTLENKEQVILFLNRRGMATFISCRDCGFVLTCPSCDVPMVYHFDKSGNFLICHHCERRHIVPAQCPVCSSTKIRYFGSGVEKIDTEIRSSFPHAKIKMIDSKILQNQNDYEQFYHDFRNHKFDIVIGTQILAKGFDIPNVSLVGVISADVGLHLPHFRAEEKIFRLITQVSGRSGRREKTGRTLIQTYWPESPAIKFASKHDFEGFYEEEIEKRNLKKYPPMSHIIRVLAEHSSKAKAKEKIMTLAGELKTYKIDFIGPGPCFFHRLNNKFRYQILIKAEKLPDKTITNLFQQNQDFTWDVDALNLL